MLVRLATTAALLGAFAVPTVVPAPAQTAPYMVRLQDSDQLRASGVANLATRLGARYRGSILHTYERVLNGFAVSMSPDQAALLAADPAVRSVTPAQAGRLLDGSPGLDLMDPVTIVPQSWGQDRVDQRHLPLSNLYTYSSNGTGVTAYVLDSGVRVDRPEFGGRASLGIDITPPYMGNDCSGHGTGVASILGSAPIGVARNVNIVSVKIADCTGWILDFEVIAGMEWVMDQHDPGERAVANMSFAFPNGNESIDDAVTALINDGVTVVAGAGNDAVDACGSSPGRVPAVITVGASTIDDDRWYAPGSEAGDGSNWGPCVDVYAPGQQVKIVQYGGGYRMVTGTSYAAPHVSGIVARLLQERAVSPATAQAVVVNNASHTGGLMHAHASWGEQPPSTCEVGDFNPDDVAIPDNGLSVKSTIAISGCNWVPSGTYFAGVLRVSWHMDHPRTSDLLIELDSPMGSYVLDSAGGAHKRSGTKDIPVGHEARNGSWKLRVTDTVTGQTGSIGAWSLQF